MNVERDTAAGVKWTGIAKLTMQVVTWTVTLLVVRMLAPEDYGIVGIAAAVCSIVGSLAEFGLGAALVQRREDALRHAGAIAGVALLLNTAFAVLLAVASPFLGAAFGDARVGYVVAVSAFGLVLNAVAVVPEAFIYRDMRFKTLAYIDVGSAVAGSLSTLALASNGAGAWSLVASALLQNFVRTIALVATSTWVRPSFDFSQIAAHVRFGGALTGSRLAFQLTHQSDVLIGGRFLSEQALGLYTVSLHLAKMPMYKIMSVLNQVAFPAAARMQNERERLAARMLEAVGLIALGAVPLLWGLSSVAPEFTTVVLGPKWIEAALPLQLAALAVPFQLLANVISIGVTGVGRADVELRNMLTAMAVLPLAYLIGVGNGPVGLALAWLVGVPLVIALNFRRTSAVIGLRLPQIGAAIRVPVAGGMLMYAAVAGARSVLADLGDLFRLPLLVLVGALAYVAAVTLLDRSHWTRLRETAALLRSA